MKQTHLFFVFLFSAALNSSAQTVTNDPIILDNGAGKGRITLLSENGTSKLFGTTTGFGAYQPIGLAGARTLIALNGVLPPDDGLSALVVHGDIKSSSGIFRALTGSLPNDIIMGYGYNTTVGDYSYLKVPGLATNNAEIRLTQNGNIGIGTATPVAKLHVNQGSTASQQELSAFSIGRNELTNGFYRFVTNYDVADISKIYLGIKTGADLYALTINNNTGNIAIGGTDSKGYKLSVAGSMIAEKIKVKNQSAWPDFVFDPGYLLPSLESVEGFIKANKHLPEIPSAKDIARDDHDLAEMNKKLLQKVEELTLYLIDQQKQLVEQKAELSALKKQMGGKN